LSSASAKSSISTFLQLLQFGISVLSLQLFWYFFFSSVSAIWYLRSVSAKKKIIKFGVIFCLPLLQNLVFRLSFSFCNLVFLSVSAIVLVFRLLFSFCNLVSASAICYFCSVSAIVFVFRLLFNFCNLVFELSFCKFFFGVIFCLPLL